MGIIELAVLRLEELRRSGIEVLGKPAAAVPSSDDSLVSRATRRVEEARADGATVMRPSAPGSTLDTSVPGGSGSPWTTDLIGPRRESLPLAGRKVSIDLERMHALGYLTARSTRTQMASEFRVVKRQLLVNASESVNEHANLIMVTSALPGEGKTFVAINLAVSIAAEVDRNVLLVDADVARPSVLSRLGLAPAPGLLDALAEPSVHWSDVMLRTNIEKLTLLSAGAPQENATEMLASDAMKRMLHELASQDPDRVIVFDAPPLLPSTESRVLATRMGQVILVVEAKRTPKKAVEQALATVDSCPMVLPLLNKATRSELGTYYGYYGLEQG